MVDLSKALEATFGSGVDVPADITACITAGEKVIAVRERDLRMADSASWLAVEKFSSDPLCANESEEKRWRKAQKEAKEEVARKKAWGQPGGVGPTGVRESTALVAGASGPAGMAGDVTEVGATGTATDLRAKEGRMAAGAMEEVAGEVTEVVTEADMAVGMAEAKVAGPRGAEAKSREAGATGEEASESSWGLVQAGGQWWVLPGMPLRRTLKC